MNEMEAIRITLEQISNTAMQLNNDTIKVIVDRPISQSGGGNGLMGGQYLLTGIGGCFCSTFFAAAQSRSFEIEGFQVDVIATKSEDLPKRFTDIRLDVSYKKCSDPVVFKKLLRIAEMGCISINTIKEGMGLKVHQK
ncbi:OsmC family protein [Aquimarina sp. AU58]|uniref:OsmC family protein n=1 Tax=Aquimarina sp. AU58 TaxID=1874112 RepID=UPI000D65B3D5|nr:OsmC family protein [Aquimarina sp. AU58]